MPPIFKADKPLFITSGTAPAYHTDCCCNIIYKKCSDDTVFGYNDEDIGDYIWHIDGSSYIKLYSDGTSTTTDDMTGCTIDPSKASCAALNFSDLDYGFDAADTAAAACWIAIPIGTPTWNGADVTLTGELDMRYDVIMTTIGTADFRMEIDFTGFGGFNSGMPAGSGKDGSVSMVFKIGTDIFSVGYYINGSNWEGRTASTDSGSTVHETISSGVPSTPFTFFIDRSGTTIEIGNETNWSTTYTAEIAGGDALIGDANTKLNVRDQSAGFGLFVDIDEMRFTP